MNREIKFRGKDRKNWHYGDLVQEIRHNDNKLFDGVITHIRNFEYKNGDYIGNNFPVNSDTIGQYTGLQDKNGKEIYEGDIIKCKRYIGGNFVDYCIENGFVELKDGEFGLHRKQGYYQSLKNFLEYDYELEIRGNIYDNPELLGGKHIIER